MYSLHIHGSATVFSAFIHQSLQWSVALHIVTVIIRNSPCISVAILDYFLACTFGSTTKIRNICEFVWSKAHHNGLTRTSKVRYGLICGEFWCLLNIVKDATDIIIGSLLYTNYFELLQFSYGYLLTTTNSYGRYRAKRSAFVSIFRKYVTCAL